jgi:hypothetical protein
MKYFNFYISIDRVKYFNQKNTQRFDFLKDLEYSQDDADKRRKQRLEENNLRSGILKKPIKGWRDMEFENSADEYSPDFYTLNKSLQKEFVNFLEHLEIKPDIANYIKYLGLNRERREYISWMYKIIKLLND